MQINMETRKLKGLLLFIVMGLLLINYYIPFQNVRINSTKSSGEEVIDRGNIMEIISKTEGFQEVEENNKKLEESIRRVASSGNLTQRVNKSKNPEEIREEKIREIAEKTQMEKEWTETLLDKAEKYDIDMYLLLGLIRVESVFDPENVSSAGALGIMQIMPGTARFLADNLDVNYSREKLFNPHYNMKLGTYYVNYLMELYDGDVDKVLTAYNRGEGGLNSFIRRTGNSESAFSRMVQQKASKYEDKIEVSEFH